MKKVLLLASASLFLVACGGSEWTASDQSEYMAGCQSDGYVSKEYCQCTMEYLQAEFPGGSSEIEKNPEAAMTSAFNAASECSQHLDF
tara:strand:+ start:1068 stop:1331 length:264 start_codon:yes stop_codon:yes gene_type:complete